MISEYNVNLRLNLRLKLNLGFLQLFHSSASKFFTIVQIFSLLNLSNILKYLDFCSGLVFALSFLRWISTYHDLKEASENG